ncbi:MAG: hypothetical protein L5657_04530 [Calditerricola sp.]|nr:hypothetical protein [Bacillota bacterium]MCG0313909.1 hypothetical protein [Calditerricola sp.]
MSRMPEEMPLRVYVEYRVVPERRGEYESRMRAWQARVAQLPVVSYSRYEGLDQPHLMVEEYLVPDAAAYRLLKDLRTGRREPDAPWQIGTCVQGGWEKVHVWAFVPRGGNEAGDKEQAGGEQEGRR